MFNRPPCYSANRGISRHGDAEEDMDVAPMELLKENSILGVQNLEAVPKNRVRGIWKSAALGSKEVCRTYLPS